MAAVKPHVSTPAAAPSMAAVKLSFFTPAATAHVALVAQPLMQEPQPLLQESLLLLEESQPLQSENSSNKAYGSYGQFRYAQGAKSLQLQNMTETVCSSPCKQL
jgi:hypothetical protein